MHGKSGCLGCLVGKSKGPATAVTAMRVWAAQEALHADAHTSGGVIRVQGHDAADVKADICVVLCGDSLPLGVDTGMVVIVRRLPQ